MGAAVLLPGFGNSVVAKSDDTTLIDIRLPDSEPAYPEEAFYKKVPLAWREHLDDAREAKANWKASIQTYQLITEILDHLCIISIVMISRVPSILLPIGPGVMDHTIAITTHVPETKLEDQLVTKSLPRSQT